MYPRTSEEKIVVYIIFSADQENLLDFLKIVNFIIFGEALLLTTIYTHKTTSFCSKLACYTHVFSCFCACYFICFTNLKIFLTYQKG